MNEIQANQFIVTRKLPEMDPELDFAAQAGFDLKPEVLEVLVHMLRAEYSPDAIVAVLQDIKNRKMKQMLSSMN